MEVPLGLYRTTSIVTSPILVFVIKKEEFFILIGFGDLAIYFFSISLVGMKTGTKFFFLLTELVNQFGIVEEGLAPARSFMGVLNESRTYEMLSKVV